LRFCCSALVCFRAQAQELTCQFSPSTARISFTIGDILHTLHGSFNLKSGEVHYDPGTAAVRRKPGCRCHFRTTSASSERRFRPGAALNDIVPLWMKIALGAIFSFSAIIGIWRHGLKNWDWLMFVLFLGIIFFSARGEPLGRNLSWPLRVVFVLWVIACSALFVHV
jgi:hypothetical protein